MKVKCIRCSIIVDTTLIDKEKGAYIHNKNIYCYDCLFYIENNHINSCGNCEFYIFNECWFTSDGKKRINKHPKSKACNFFMSNLIF
jgi:hypothetical protein